MKSKQFHRTRAFTIASAAAVLIGVFLASFYLEAFRPETKLAVQLALLQARHSPLIRQVIGTPLTTGWLVTGRVSSSMGNGNADLKIPIAGPRGKGTLVEWAQETQNTWHLCSLVFRSSKSDESIALIRDETSPCDRE